MIKCPFCGATHVANTIFCSECGNYLLEDERRKTDPLENGEIGWVGDMAEDAPKTSSRQIAKPIAIQLKIGADKKREVEVNLNKTINLGRVDPTATVFPEVDLTDEGPPAKSVSRRHARILRRENTVVLEDLGSINGTFVNGRKITPYVPVTLQDGDIMQLGRIPIEVAIQYQ